MACKEGQFDVVELIVNDQFKTFSINLNAQHLNGLTPFDLEYLRLLDTLEKTRMKLFEVFCHFGYFIFIDLRVGVSLTFLLQREQLTSTIAKQTYERKCDRFIMVQGAR